MLPKRKATRLKFSDYHTPGAYFITICTQNRLCLLSRVTGNGTGVILSDIGECIEQVFSDIAARYPHVKVDKYVIMPNHIHLLLMLQGDTASASVTDVVRILKSMVGHKAGRGIFQRSFHDHIIRTQEDYRAIWQYIDTNPLCWV